MRHSTSKLVVLLHGWLGRPGALRRLPKMLAERGHDVLPLFHQFDSWPRGVTMEELAERLETWLERERRDRPTVLIAHSMGGLVALTWMLRHHAEKGRRPPVERLVAFGTPLHGVRLRPFARAFIKWGLVPGTALARQMQAPNLFLWDLARSELRHAEYLPPIICGAGLLRRSTPVTALVGGRESDGVVPAVCAQPNASFVTATGHVQRLPPRAFHVFSGRAHNGPRGLYAGLQPADRDPRTALLISSTERLGAEATLSGREDGVRLRQALCIVRHRPSECVILVGHGSASDAGVRGDEDRRNGLSLFLLQTADPGGVIPSTDLRVGRGSWSLPSGELRGGSVVYIDLLS